MNKNDCNLQVFRIRLYTTTSVITINIAIGLKRRKRDERKTPNCCHRYSDIERERTAFEELSNQQLID